MGPAWGDATVLRVGHHLERALGTRERRPTLHESPGSAAGMGANAAPMQRDAVMTA
jgi:hypothetical protein